MLVFVVYVCYDINLFGSIMLMSLPTNVSDQL